MSDNNFTFLQDSYNNYIALSNNYKIEYKSDVIEVCTLINNGSGNPIIFGGKQIFIKHLSKQALTIEEFKHWVYDYVKNEKMTVVKPAILVKYGDTHVYEFNEVKCVNIKISEDVDHIEDLFYINALVKNELIGFKRNRMILDSDDYYPYTVFQYDYLINCQTRTQFLLLDQKDINRYSLLKRIQKDFNDTNQDYIKKCQFDINAYNELKKKNNDIINSFLNRS